MIKSQLIMDCAVPEGSVFIPFNLAIRTLDQTFFPLKVCLQWGHFHSADPSSLLYKDPQILEGKKALFENANSTCMLVMELV